MKTKLWLLALLGMVLLHTSAAWADDFYVIAGGRGVGTRITSLPYTISTPGFYYLGGNLAYTGSANAITVEADNVTLDLMGFSLAYSGTGYTSNGVYMEKRTNVEIRNGTVSGFYHGVFEASSSGARHRAINIRAADNTYGILFFGTNHLISHCNSSNNSWAGLFLGSGLISDCVASDNTYGIALQGPGNVLGNTAFNNAYANFSLGNYVATAILVDRNSAFGLTTNYEIRATSGVQWGTNAGTP